MGEINGVIGVATDITQQLKAEKLRIELEKEQEMIALKERFIATASHDFRTPLTIIKMNANMLHHTFQDSNALLKSELRNCDRLARKLIRWHSYWMMS